MMNILNELPCPHVTQIRIRRCHPSEPISRFLNRPIHPQDSRNRTHHQRAILGLPQRVHLFRFPQLRPHRHRP
jgi:hypothetical protein